MLKRNQVASDGKEIDRRDRLYCDECHEEIKAYTEEQVLADIGGGGWSDYKTAQKHICQTCADARWQRLWDERDPCGECRNEPCRRGHECWFTPSFGTYYPYETYYADRLDRYKPPHTTLEEFDAN